VGAAVPEEFALVQVEEEDREDQDDDEGSGEEKDYCQEAGLVWGTLLDLKVLQILLQPFGEPFRVIVLVWHVG
jgi:hypothetical protein